VLCSDVRSALIFRRSKPVGENIKLFTCDLVSFNIRMFFVLLWCVLVLEIPDLTWFLCILSEYKAKTPKNVSFTIESIVFHSSSGAIQHGARSQNMTYFQLHFLIGPSITMLYPVLVYISDCCLHPLANLRAHMGALPLNELMFLIYLYRGWNLDTLILTHI
jgi:hypothetical protein